MLNVAKSFKIAGSVALLVASTACTPYQVRQGGIWGPPVTVPAQTAGDCLPAGTAAPAPGDQASAGGDRCGVAQR